jgi:hypothetical protein
LIKINVKEKIFQTLNMSSSIEKRNADFKQAVFAENGESFDVGQIVKIISAIEHAAAFALAEEAFKAELFPPE